jgi:predicted MPP superfamily phosphohydrolase
MLQHPNRKMTVLCGHTHGGGTAQILPNLTTITGPAEYRSPVIQSIFDFE